MNRKTDIDTLNWSEVQHWRMKYRKVLPPIHALPILPSIERWIIDTVNASQTPLSILDIGAGGRVLFDKLSTVHDKIIYKSQDVDRSQQHDYYDTKEIEDQFDIVTSSEVIEHLGAEEKVLFMDELYRMTKSGGWCALTTPNANHPTIFWRDFTHIMPIHYLDLAGITARAGYQDVGIYRLAKMSFRKRLTVWYYRRLLKLLHCDFAQSILAVGRKVE